MMESHLHERKAAGEIPAAMSLSIRQRGQDAQLPSEIWILRV